MEVPTVKIASDRNPKGYRIINQSDFDPAAHRLYGEPEAKPAPESAEAPVVAPYKRGPGRPRKAS